MSISLDISQRDEYTIVTVSGEYSGEAAKSSFLALLEKIDGNSTPILVDLRSLQGLTQDLLKVYEYAQFIAQELVQRGLYLKLAYLYQEDSTLSIEHFGENVAVNRGTNVKVFNDEQKAIAWLTSR